MNKRLLICAAVLFVAAGWSVAADKGKEGSWTGWITDTHCGAKGDTAKHADCAKKCADTMGAKYALYVPGDKKVYQLEPQDKVTPHAGHHVTLKGSAENGTIKIESVQMTPEPKTENKPM